MKLYIKEAFFYDNGMPAVETEVKFHLADPAGMRARLVALGALSRGRSLERNIRFEDPGRTLAASKCLLRLRQDARATLTFKSVPADPDPRFKQLHELEVEVRDFEAMLAILKSLNFTPAQIYEKWRETFVLGGTAFCLDALPYGDFLEIEGTGESILDFSARLGLDWERRILMNYLEIFDLIRTRLNLTFTDVTFDNFAAAPVSRGHMTDLLAAGPCPPLAAAGP